MRDPEVKARLDEERQARISARREAYASGGGQLGASINRQPAQAAPSGQPAARPPAPPAPAPAPALAVRSQGINPSGGYIGQGTVVRPPVQQATQFQPVQGSGQILQALRGGLY